MANNLQPMKKKNSILPILGAYVLVFAIVGLFIWIFSGRGSGNNLSYSGSDLKFVTEKDENTQTIKVKEQGNLTKVLLEKNVVEIYIAAKTARLELSGKFVEIEGDNKKVTYSFSGVFLPEERTTLQSILDFRVVQKFDNNNNPILENGKPVYVNYYTSSNVSVTDPYASNFVRDYLPTILIYGVGIILALWAFSRLSKSITKGGAGGIDPMSFDKSRARRESDSKVRFKDVAGCDEVKDEFIEIVDYLKNGSKYTKLGAKLPKGVLLVGPPGTGKTLMAKAVAGEAGVPFFSISGSDFVEMFVGVGAGRVRDMFKTAKENAPCLVFIDEIDAVGRQRGAGMGGGNDEREQTLNQLLVEMDGFAENAGIIVMAATNREDVLDPALLRAGRFDRQITVDLPDKQGREDIFKVHAKNKKIDPSVDFAQIAKRTVGFSGADIANILNDAAILAVRNNRVTVLTKDIDEAIDRSIAGPAKKNRALREVEKRSVAYHEAGHAIIGLTLPFSDKVQKVTIVPRGRTGGHVMMTPEDDRFLMTRNELIARIVGYLGGRTSEEIFFKDVSTGASNDIQVATRIARSMVTEYGMSKLGPVQYESDNGNVFLGRDYTSTQKNFSSQVAYEIDNEVRGIIEEAHKEANRIITERKEDVILIAETLMKVETLTSEQITYLLANRELPKEVENKKEEPIATEAIITPVVKNESLEVKSTDDVLNKEIVDNSEATTPNLEAKPKTKRTSKKADESKGEKDE